MISRRDSQTSSVHRDRLRETSQPGPRIVTEDYQQPRDFEAELSNPRGKLPEDRPRYMAGPPSDTEQLNPPSSSRQERRYYSSGGYNAYSPASNSGPTYQTTQASSSRVTYDADSSIARAADEPDFNNYISSTTYNLPYSPPSELQWTTAPLGPGRGSQVYQGRGKTPAPREPRYINATCENKHLDRSYQMRTTDWKRFFDCGRVFEIVRTDPVELGSGSESESESENEQFMSRAKYGFAHGHYGCFRIQRFIVVARHDRSCVCLPVTTYNGKGYRKRNIKLEEHGLIFTGNRLPKPIPGIAMEPLKIKDSVEKLDLSCINYGRSYYVDTDVKVKNIGVLDSFSQKLLRKYYKAIHASEDDDDSDNLRGSITRVSKSQSQVDELTGMGGFTTSYEDQYNINNLPAYSTRAPQKTVHSTSQDASSTPSVKTKRDYSGSSGVTISPSEDVFATNVEAVDQEHGQQYGMKYGSKTDETVDSPADEVYVDQKQKDDGRQTEWLDEFDLAEEEEAERTFEKSDLKGNKLVVNDSQMNSCQARDEKVHFERARPDIDSKSPNLSRTSSSSSLSSLKSLRSVFSSSGSTRSSTSSANMEPLYQQRLETLLLNDPELHALLETAIQQTTFQKFENNFKRCLHLFSEHLRIEAPASLPKHTSKLIRRFSSNVAHSIRRSFENVSPSDGPVDSRRPNAFLAEDASDSDESEEHVRYDEEDDIEDLDDSSLSLEASLLATNSFMMLRENFRIFLLSDQILRAVFDCWPVTLPWSEEVTIEYSGIGSLIHYLKSRPRDQRQLEKILTFTGADDAVEATSCEEYLVRQWPQVGQCLVDCLNQLEISDGRSMLTLHPISLLYWYNTEI